MRMRGKKPIFTRKDTWSMDVTLSPIIAEGIKKFKSVMTASEMAGYPSDLSENGEMDKWLWMLDEMIYAFEYDEYKDNIYWDAYSKQLDTTFVDVPGGKQMIFNTDPELQRRFYWASACVEARRQRGMKFFCDYYRSLWW